MNKRCQQGLRNWQISRLVEGLQLLRIAYSSPEQIKRIKQSENDGVWRLKLLKSNNMMEGLTKFEYENILVRASWGGLLAIGVASGTSTIKTEGGYNDGINF